MSHIKKLAEERGALEAKVAQFIQETDGREMTAEERSKFDKLDKEFREKDEAYRAEQRKEDVNRQIMEERADQRKTTGDPESKEMEKKIFRKALASGKREPDYTPEERAFIEKRAAITGIKTDENFVPKEMIAAIEIAMKTVAGMMEAGSIINTTRGGDLILPTVNDVTSKAYIIDELDSVDEETKPFGSITMKAFTYATPVIPISYEAVQDSVFDIESVVAQLLGASYGRGTNEHMTIGNGTTQPQGILTAAPVGANAAGATAVTFDDLIDLMASVDPAYANSGRWMFNNNTLYALMKIKDANGQYIWQPATTAGTPAMIWGKSYVLNTDMPDIASGATPILFGALSKYQIRIVKNFSVQVLRELYAKNRAIGILGFARMDGRLIDAGTNPVKKLQLA